METGVWRQIGKEHRQNARHSPQSLINSMPRYYSKYAYSYPVECVLFSPFDRPLLYPFETDKCHTFPLIQLFNVFECTLCCSAHSLVSNDFIVCTHTFTWLVLSAGTFQLAMQIMAHWESGMQINKSVMHLLRDRRRRHSLKIFRCKQNKRWKHSVQMENKVIKRQQVVQEASKGEADAENSRNGERDSWVTRKCVFIGHFIANLCDIWYQLCHSMELNTNLIRLPGILVCDQNTKKSRCSIKITNNGERKTNTT